MLFGLIPAFIVSFGSSEGKQWDAQRSAGNGKFGLLVPVRCRCRCGPTWLWANKNCLIKLIKILSLSAELPCAGGGGIYAFLLSRRLANFGQDVVRVIMPTHVQGAIIIIKIILIKFAAGRHMSVYFAKYFYTWPAGPAYENVFCRVGVYSWFEPLSQFDDFWPCLPDFPPSGPVFSVFRTIASAFRWGSVGQTDSHAYFMARSNTASAALEGQSCSSNRSASQSGLKLTPSE